jgi:hypothetical protein
MTAATRRRIDSISDSVYPSNLPMGDSKEDPERRRCRSGFFVSAPILREFGARLSVPYGFSGLRLVSGSVVVVGGVLGIVGIVDGIESRVMDVVSCWNMVVSRGMELVSRAVVVSCIIVVSCAALES